MHSPNPAAQSELPRAAADVLARLRARAPRVHCVTNTVAQNFTANVLLAAGCVPSMTLSANEVGDFVSRSNALLINLGTFDRERREAVEIAVETASEAKLPWVLDPVFVDRAPDRAGFARELAARGPAAVRLNAAEFTTLFGGGPDRDALVRAAAANKLVVALSGATDFVSDGTRIALLGNGHPLMAKVTAMGCAGSALVAACLAVEADAFRAVTAGMLLLGVAGELAARDARGPGSFAAAIIDALHALDEAAVMRLARVS